MKILEQKTKTMALRDKYEVQREKLASITPDQASQFQ